MSTNAEQYTVKTPEEILNDEINRDHERGIRSAAVAAMREYSFELIKENERLKGTIGVECVKQLLEAREENKLYREALTEAKEVLQWHLDNSAPCHAIYHSDFFNLTANAITQADEVLSKFQPKKDESLSKG